MQPRYYSYVTKSYAFGSLNLLSQTSSSKLSWLSNVYLFLLQQNNRSSEGLFEGTVFLTIQCEEHPSGFINILTNCQKSFKYLWLCFIHCRYSVLAAIHLFFHRKKKIERIKELEQINKELGSQLQSAHNSQQKRDSSNKKTKGSPSSAVESPSDLTTETDEDFNKDLIEKPTDSKKKVKKSSLTVKTAGHGK